MKYCKVVPGTTIYEIFTDYKLLSQLTPQQFPHLVLLLLARYISIFFYIYIFLYLYILLLYYKI